MNAQNTALATQQQQNRETLPMTSVGISTGAGSKIAPQNLGEVVKFAEVMSRADIALPKHLRGNPGACMAVALQAMEWELSPFAVASKSYAVNGMIAYEAQLIVAVVNTRSGIEGRLKYHFEGEGGDRVCICTGKIDGEEREVRSPKFKDITPKNSPLWKSDPDQQQCYYTGRSWARRHTPEVILGVYDRDEVESIKDVTPQQGTGLAARLQGAQGGFNAQTIESTLEEAQERPEEQSGTQEPAEEESQPAATSVDWNNAEEATKALDAGLLPEGFLVNEFGALVIPDELHGKKGGPRGHSIIAASFEEIVTASGVVVKSKAPPPADDDFPGDLPFEGDE